MSLYQILARVLDILAFFVSIGGLLRQPPYGRYVTSDIFYRISATLLSIRPCRIDKRAPSWELCYFILFLAYRVCEFLCPFFDQFLLTFFFFVI